MNESKLFEVCKASGIAIQKKPLTGIEGDDREYYKLSVPAGREFRYVSIFHDEDINDAVAALPHYRFIPGLDAIWSADLGIIQCRVAAPRASAITAIQKIARAIQTVKTEVQRSEGSKIDRAISITVDGSPQCDSVYLGPSSAAYDVLTSLSTRLSIIIIGVSCSSSEEAKHKLEQISNALFFQCDLACGVALHLGTERRPFRPAFTRTSEIVQVKPAFDASYDRDVMSLYWYARTARDVPLLEFLSFYQVLEHFFPLFSKAEAVRAVSTLTKSPLFDRHSERFASQIVEAVSASLRGGGISEERAQLKSTLRAIVLPEELASFFTFNDRKNFYSSAESKKISSFQINLTNPNLDLQASVAERVYDIRCKIVHSKSQGEDQKPLLPFSREANMLHHDIDLIQFLATKAVIQHVRPLTTH